MLYALVEDEGNGEWLELIALSNDLSKLELDVRLGTELRNWAIDNDQDPRIAHNWYTWIPITGVDITERKAELQSQLAVIELFEMGKA